VDAKRFDQLTRALAEGRTRRRVLRTIGAAIAGAVMSVAGRSGTDAARSCRSFYPTGHICRKHGDCCSHFCAPKDRMGRRRCDECPNGNPPCGDLCCTADQGCVDGVCCDAPCGNGCCASGQTCVTLYDDGEPFEKCCDYASFCSNEGNCCWDDTICVHDNSCCAPANVCLGEYCCQADETCVENGCCLPSNVCTAGDVSYCCGDAGCDENGCLASACEVDSDCPNVTFRCCGGVCVEGECCGDADCDGFTCCNNFCVDPRWDNRHCDGCGNHCGYYQDDPEQPNCCFDFVCTDAPTCAG
jgi:hypothetical protein